MQLFIQKKSSQPRNAAIDLIVSDVASHAGVLQKLGRGVWTCVGAVMLVLTALGLLSLMTGVLADLVLAPFR